MSRSAALLSLLLVAGPMAAFDSRDPPDPRWQAWAQHAALEQASPFHGLQWRALGPTVQGGRVVDVESIPGDPYGFYVAYASGGVWKTTAARGNRDRLFHSMVSLRKERSGCEPHLGLGLYVARLIAEFHGGSITAQTLPDAEGVEVAVILPLVQPQD